MRRKGVDQAWEALEEMMRAGLPADRFTVSRMLMRTLAEGRRYWDAAKITRCVYLVEQFVTLQPAEADEVLFNAILDTHSRTKDIQRLELAFQRMRDLGVEPSHVTLGILVKAYGQVCDIKRVLHLWGEMKEQREQANAVTYGCMINACVKCSHTDMALEIFRNMQSLNKPTNTILYTTLIKGYGNEKDLNTALMLFREMKDQNVPYNTVAYNSIIDVCIKCSEVVAAEELFKEMISDGSTTDPDLITYSTLLKGYCQIGDLDKALQVAETIKASGLQCDELVYNTLMDGCVRANDLSAGVGLFAEMISSGMAPSAITHSIFLRLYQKNGYKGNALDAVAQLYHHHGLEKPSGSVEKASKAAARREVRSRGQPSQEVAPGSQSQSQSSGQHGEGFGNGSGKGFSNSSGKGSSQGFSNGGGSDGFGGGKGGSDGFGGGKGGSDGFGGGKGGSYWSAPNEGQRGMNGMEGMSGMQPPQNMMSRDQIMMAQQAMQPEQHPRGTSHGFDASQRTPATYGQQGCGMRGTHMAALPDYGIASRPASFGGVGLEEFNYMYGGPGMPMHPSQTNHRTPAPPWPVQNPGVVGHQSMNANLSEQMGGYPSDPRRRGGSMAQAAQAWKQSASHQGPAGWNLEGGGGF
ncbi:unnamed protein product [Polarella glacialis]|uniref:Pentacotripeptide-repeat region of PRORP domain-containing protein n=1 Tax=Polarella glacialis TaxID=89957 RepID=A0A813JH48_POLGL|nr:unnamed protein product [Polarella glacialis]